MNTIKYMLYIGLLGLGYKASAMFQPENQKQLEKNILKDLIEQYSNNVGYKILKKEARTIAQQAIEKRKSVRAILMENYSYDVTFESFALETKPHEEYEAFIAEAYSEKTRNDIEEKADAIVKAKIDAIVKAKMLLPNAQNHNQLHNTSPNKTLPIDKKRKLIRPQQDSTTPSCMTPPAKRRLFEIE